MNETRYEASSSLTCLSTNLSRDILVLTGGAGDASSSCVNACADADAEDACADADGVAPDGVSNPFGVGALRGVLSPGVAVL